MPALVLLLTHSGDHYTIDLVEEEVRARGARAIRVDTDRFPAASTLALSFGGAGTEPVELGYESERIDLRAVDAIWTRRLWPGRVPPGMDPRLAAYASRESRTAFFDTLALVDGPRWVNPPLATLRAESKLLQLQAAGDVGLAIPPTLVTNDPDAVRAFHRAQGGDIVTKLLGALSQTMDASGDFVYTSIVTDEDMDAIDAVQLAPQIFQSHIHKQRELRVIVVGERFFVGAIDPSSSERGRVDWRRMRTDEDVAWTEGALSTDSRARVRALLARLGLVYGAVDFLIDHEGRELFLEVNPAGEWGWLQRDLDMPIAEAIADALLEVA